MQSTPRAAHGRLAGFAALALTLTIPGGCGSATRQASGPLTGLHVLSSITDGAVLADPVAWTAQPVGLANGDAVDRVKFLIDGRVRWTEHQPPYFFNDDHNGLYPWVLGVGQHRLAVRVTTLEGKSASTSAQVTVQPPPQPAALAGTYTRTVTAADIRRTQQSHHEPANQVLSAGTWRLRIARDGIFFFESPRGGGGSEAFSALADGTLTMHGPVNWLEPPSNQGGFCGIEPAGTYRWAITARKLVLTVRRDRCADRNSMFTGEWRRT